VINVAGAAIGGCLQLTSVEANSILQALGRCCQKTLLVFRQAKTDKVIQDHRCRHFWKARRRRLLW